MPGVVSLLDERSSKRVVELRRQLETKLNIESPVENHYPHFSYQVADSYDDEELGRTLEELPDEQDSFTVRTNGIGVFSDTEPLIVYIPIVRTAQLSRFHERIWTRSKPVAIDLEDYYHPELWIPHITIASVEKSDLYSVMNLLSQYSLSWNVEIDNVATIRGMTPNRRVEHRVPLDDVDAEQ